jgi:hypothetical protein
MRYKQYKNDGAPSRANANVPSQELVEIIPADARYSIITESSLPNRAKDDK